MFFAPWVFCSLGFRCTHYRRRCKIRAPCCDAIFSCRHCHNDSTVWCKYHRFLLCDLHWKHGLRIFVAQNLIVFPIYFAEWCTWASTSWCSKGKFWYVSLCFLFFLCFVLCIWEIRISVNCLVQVVCLICDTEQQVIIPELTNPSIFFVYRNVNFNQCIVIFIFYLHLIGFSSMFQL